MIEVKNVSLEIKKKRILSNVSLNIENNKIIGLVGNNGCGKTMLMKCICGFIKPGAGEINVDGKIIGKDMDYLNGAGIIIESPGFIGYYSGLKNLRLLASISGSHTGKEKIRETMELCGLDPDLRLSVRKYSLGMKQRLGIAQAIMEDQHILILDEPMNGLDRSGVEDIRQVLLKKKSEENVILITSHNKEDIDVLCDHVYEMDMGEISKIR